MKRTLSLKKETLAELAAAELAAVNGAAAKDIPTVDVCPLTGLWPTIPVNWCLSRTTVATAGTCS